MSRTCKNHTAVFKQKAVELNRAKSGVGQVSHKTGVFSQYFTVGEKNVVLMIKIASQVLVKLN